MGTYHNWGDESFNWAQLYLAESYISDLYYRITKRRPITKEKYGTIRYEWMALWITNEQEFLIFMKIIKRTIRKFPTLAGEIVNDLVPVVSNPYFAAWLEGVLWASSGEQWTSNESRRQWDEKE